jgi:pimeloyl-ACP methyl ester carboxylesterase
MLYVMGSEDHMFLPPVRQIVEKHKNSALKVIEQCGHVCNVERPGAFNRISIQYLKAHS